jgi:hypothetical protein
MIDHGKSKQSPMYYVDYCINKFEIYNLKFPDKLNWKSCDIFMHKYIYLEL